MRRLLPLALLACHGGPDGPRSVVQGHHPDPTTVAPVTAAGSWQGECHGRITFVHGYSTGGSSSGSGASTFSTHTTHVTVHVDVDLDLTETDDGDLTGDLAFESGDTVTQSTGATSTATRTGSWPLTGTRIGSRVHLDVTADGAATPLSDTASGLPVTFALTLDGEQMTGEFWVSQVVTIYDGTTPATETARLYTLECTLDR